MERTHLEQKEVNYPEFSLHKVFVGQPCAGRFLDKLLSYGIYSCCMIRLLPGHGCEYISAYCRRPGTYIGYVTGFRGKRGFNLYLGNQPETFQIVQTFVWDLPLVLT